MSDVVQRSRGPSLEQSQEPSYLEGLDARVDLVIEDHKVVLADLEKRIHSDLHGSGFTQPVGRTTPPRVTRRAWDQTEVHLDETVLADRRERERVLREMKPEIVRPHLDAAVVTRVGVLYVPPEFYQAKGIDRRMDAVLLRDGLRSIETFQAAADTRIAALTGLTLSQVNAAKGDLDLTAVPGVGRHAADLLRAVGVQSVSRLAKADPVILHADLARLRAKHRFFEFPSALSSEEGVARLVSEAKVRA